MHALPKRLLPFAWLALHLGLIAPAGSAAEPLAAGVPAETVVLLELSDLSDLAAGVRESSVGQAVAGSPQLRSGLTFLRSGIDFFSHYAADVSWSDLAARLPKQWVVAAFPLPVGSGELERPGVVCAGRLDDPGDSQLRDLLEQRLVPRVMALGEQGRPQPEQHRDVLLHRLQEPGKPPALLAHTGEYVLLGNGRGVRRMIDHLRDPDKSLGDSARLGEALGTAGPTSMPMRVVVRLDNQGPWQSVDLADSKERKDRTYMGGDALRTLSAGSRAADGRFDERLRLGLAKGAEPGLLGLLNDRQPIPFAGHQLVPASYPAYMALSLTRGDDLLRGGKELMGRIEGAVKRQELEDGLQFIEAALNLDLEGDLLARLGPELFLAVRPAAEGWAHATRVPGWGDVRFLGGVQVREPKVVLFIIQRIIESELLRAQGWTVTREAHRGEVICVAELGGKPTSAIAYTVVDDFLVIAHQREPIQHLLDARHRGDDMLTATLGEERFPLARPAVAMVYVDPTTTLAALAPVLLAQAPPAVQPFRPALAQLLGSLGAVRLAVTPTPAGPVLASDASLPWLTTVTALAGLDRFGKATVERRAVVAEERMKKIEEGLRKFRQQNRFLPGTLGELTEPYLDHLPRDPFTDERDFGYGTDAGANAWVLTSVGPDGQADVRLDRFAWAEWERVRASRAAADVEAAKRWVYRHLPDEYPDEAALDDEGDVVRVGQ